MVLDVAVLEIRRRVSRARERRECQVLLTRSAGMAAFEAIAERDVPGLAYVLDEGGTPLEATELSSERRTLLIAAACTGAAESVKYLLSRGALTTSSDAVGWTSLHHAAARGHDAVCRLLLQGGADPNARTESGRLPLDVVAATDAATRAVLEQWLSRRDERRSDEGGDAAGAAGAAAEVPAVRTFSGDPAAAVRALFGAPDCAALRAIVLGGAAYGESSSGVEQLRLSKFALEPQPSERTYGNSPKVSAWQELPSLPLRLEGAQACAWRDDNEGKSKVFVSGGLTQAAGARAYSWSAFVGTATESGLNWAEAAQPPAMSRAGGCAELFAHEGRRHVLLAGGVDMDGRALSTTESYDTDLAAGGIAWGTRGPLITPRAHFASGSLRGERVVLSGGAGGGELGRSLLPLYSSEQFLPSQNAWIGLPEMLRHSSGGRGCAGSVLSGGGGSFVVCGGDSGERITACAQMFEFEAQAWIALPPMRHARTGHCACALDGAGLLVTGGHDSTTKHDTDVELFDPRANYWIELPGVMLEPRWHAAMVAAR